MKQSVWPFSTMYDTAPAFLSAQDFMLTGKHSKQKMTKHAVLIVIQICPIQIIQAANPSKENETAYTTYMHVLMNV